MTVSELNQHSMASVTDHRPVELTLDQCIKCNICTTVCPVSPVTDLFPGPKYEGPQSGRFRQARQPTPDYSVDYCNGCRNCNMVCPTGVRIAEINARARAQMVEQGQVPFRTRIRNNLLARPATLGKYGQPLAPLSNFLLMSRPGHWLAEQTLGFSSKTSWPPFARQKFSSWLNKRKPASNGSAGKVVFFHGCTAEYYEPRVAKAAIHVLEANGFEVIVPPQDCCGLPLLSNGEFPAAR
jgi:glycerol-3-phosphate dehydrogenase subunit C